MIDIQSTIQASEELTQGPCEPNVKAALWFGALSANCPLARNCALALKLRPYIHKPLPDREELFQLLHVFTVALNCLYYIEFLEKSGQLRGLEHIGSTRVSAQDIPCPCIVGFPPFSEREWQRLSHFI